jgi:hypothetical protein
MSTAVVSKENKKVPPAFLIWNPKPSDSGSSGSNERITIEQL